MESNNYSIFITEIVEAMLPRFSSRKLVLVMGINSFYSVYEGDKAFNENESFLIVFHRPSNYTKVLVKKIERKENMMLKSLEKYGDIDFKLLSDHDSCWTSDGMRWIFKSYIDLRDKAENAGFDMKTIKEHENWRFTFDVFYGKPQYYTIEKMEKIDHFNYIIEFKNQISIKDVGSLLGEE
jgi:hypothetical protein